VTEAGEKEQKMTGIGTISEILGRKGSNIWSVRPDDTVFEAIQTMADKNIGALLVMTGERLLGVISERDYTRKVALKGKSSRETEVREILSAPVITATPEETVEECMRLMTHHRVRHLPVVDGERVVGIVSMGDLVNWTISVQTVAITQLESYISGNYPG
jgi:CBS domain-containing protein